MSIIIINRHMANGLKSNVTRGLEETLARRSQRVAEVEIRSRELSRLMDRPDSHHIAGRLDPATVKNRKDRAARATIEGELLDSDLSKITQYLDELRGSRSPMVQSWIATEKSLEVVGRSN